MTQAAAAKDDKQDDQNITDEEAFASAWDDPDSGDEETPGDGEQDAGNPGDEAGDGGQGMPDAQSGSDTDNGDATAQAGGETDDEVDYRALWEKDHQRMKSWEGRLSAEAQRRKAAEEELERLQAQMAQQQAAPDADPGKQDTGDEGAGSNHAVSDEFREEYGDEIADFVEQRARELAKQEAEQLIAERLAPMEQMREEMERKAHFDAIAAEHPDYQEIADSEEFAAWIKGQPEYIQPAMVQVIQNGTPEQINELLSSYKQATNAEQRTTQQRDNRARRSAAVRGRASGPPRAVPKDDFDAGWDSF